MNKLPKILLLIVLLCSCGVAPTAQTTITPSPPTITPNSSATQLMTAIPTWDMTPPPIRFLNLSSLSSGEYLISFRDLGLSSPGKMTVSITKPNGEMEGILAQVNTTLISLSPDLNYIAELPSILNLSTREIVTYEQLADCQNLASWSPNSKQLVVTCNKNGNVELYVFTPEDRSLLQITYFGADFSGDMPSWSPDGRWIAYSKSYRLSGSSEQAGLHIIDTKCFSKPQSCTGAELGMALDFPYSWSPDSNFIAGVWGNSVDLFRVEGGRLNHDESYPIDATRPGWLSWSPSGKWIAVNTYKGNYLLSVANGKATLLNYEFVGWISIP